MNIAVITGGSSGLGFEMAHLLNGKKLNVLLVGRSLEKLELAKKKLDSTGFALVDIFACDIGNEFEVKSLCVYMEGKSYEVEYLFNVAGTGMYGKVDEITENMIDRVFSANLKGLILMCKSFVPKMENYKKGSRIVNVLSTAALKGKKMESVYYAAKWGARGFTESLKDEVQSTGIEVMTVYPGGMKTAFWNESTSGYDTQKFMDAEDVAEVIVDLALNRNVYVSEVTINRPK